MPGLQRCLTRAMAACIAVLGLAAAPGCRGGESAPAPLRPGAGVPDAGGIDAASTALLADLDKAPTRAVRCIAVLRPGAQAKAQAGAALKAAGAGGFQDLAPQPMLVIEVNAAQLRALLRTGQVLTVQRDVPAPTN